MTYLINMSLSAVWWQMHWAVLVISADWLWAQSIHTHCGEVFTDSSQVRAWAQTCPASQVGLANQTYRCVPACVCCVLHVLAAMEDVILFHLYLLNSVLLPFHYRPNCDRSAAITGSDVTSRHRRPEGWCEAIMSSCGTILEMLPKITACATY